MMESVIAIKKFKKAEELSKAFKLRAWENKLEFTNEHEKLLQEFLADKLAIVHGETRQNVAELELNLEDLEHYMNYQLNEKLIQFLNIHYLTVTETIQEKHPTLPIYKRNRYLYALR